MIFKAIVLMGLLVASASASAVKGREEYPAKGQRQVAAPVEYQRSQQYEQREAYAAKGQQQELAAAPLPEQAKLAEPELVQQEKQQFYEAQTQLRAKTEERAEEQTRLAQLPDQTRYDDYQQQEIKGAVKELKETKQQYYEAKPQVREDVTLAAAKGGPAYASKAEEQVQYQAPVVEQQAKLEEVQRVDETKGKKLEQQEQLQQAQVELTKQDYEQRRFEEQTEQRADEQVAQVREEGQVKGGLRPAGAEAEPYAFDYSVEGSSRRETGDVNGVVRGQYTIQGADGSQRIVDYVADRDGFRAQVQTNEFGTENQQPANVALRSSQPSAEGISLGLEGKTRELTPVAPALQQLQVVAPATKSAPFVQLSEAVRTKPLYEESRAYKGAPSAAVVKAEPQYELKAPVLVHESASYKGQEQQELQQRAPLEPIKSAELRAAPRTPVAQLKTASLLARASGFESATAHRPVVHTYTAPVVRHVPVHSAPFSVPVVQPVVPVVRHQLLAPVRSHQLQHVQHRHHHVQPVLGVSRSQLQHDRYPPVSHRREQPLNPRVSFYANNHEEDHSSGFDLA